MRVAQQTASTSSFTILPVFKYHCRAPLLTHNYHHTRIPDRVGFQTDIHPISPIHPTILTRRNTCFFLKECSSVSFIKTERGTKDYATKEKKHKLLPLPNNNHEMSWHREVQQPRDTQLMNSIRIQKQPIKLRTQAIASPAT
jgi:hypothetical protein